MNNFFVSENFPSKGYIFQMCVHIIHKFFFKATSNHSNVIFQTLLATIIDNTIPSLNYLNSREIMPQLV